MRKRFREFGLSIGALSVGPLNAITDVSGVAVGHKTLIQAEDIRTGVTAILPHAGNVFQDRVPAGLAVGNGFGKLTGSTQLSELGEIETPILLTNTLAVPTAARTLISWTLAQPGNESVTSVNPIVGECNDAHLNNIRKSAVTIDHCLEALGSAMGGSVPEGCVGAGTGTTAFGWKAGIGTSSRCLPGNQGGWTVGVIVQANFGGMLRIGSERSPGFPANYEPSQQPEHSGSIIIVMATDAPLSDRNLSRLARRCMAGLARAGASMSDGSGDYAIAFSTHPDVRRTYNRRKNASSILELPNALISPLFIAAMDATEEAIYNSLFMAESMSGFQGFHSEAIPVKDMLPRFQCVFT